MTLLELAEEFLLEPALTEKLPVAYFMIEESWIIPRMKPRFYSIVNDPFPD